MTTRHIRTRLTEEQVWRRVARFAASLGESESSRAQRVIDNHIFHRVFRDWERSFVDKADGGADEFARRWRPLQPQTIERKLRERAGRRRRRSGATTINPEYKFGGARRRLEFRREEKYQLLHGASFREARMRAAVRAFRLTGDTAAIKINIRTGRLLKSLSAGTLSRNRYYRTKDQVAERNGSRLIMGTEVPYAPDVDAERRLLPGSSNAAVWVHRALRESLEALAGQLIQLVRR